MPTPEQIAAGAEALKAFQPAEGPEADEARREMAEAVLRAAEQCAKPLPATSPPAAF